MLTCTNFHFGLYWDPFHKGISWIQLLLVDVRVPWEIGKMALTLFLLSEGIFVLVGFTHEIVLGVLFTVH